MKFLLDENIPPSLCRKLSELGYEARHVVKIGFNQTADVKIFELAEETNEIILTHDNDFSSIHAFSGKQKPSVILFRHQKISTEIIYKILEKHLPDLQEDLKNGVFVSVDEYSIRIRKLPIRG